jgi:thiamine biosynthesis lipoprotein
MGIDARLVVYAADQKSAEDACSAAFDRIAQLDSIMSDYRPNSELMQLCAKAGGPAIEVSPDLFKVLQRAQQVSRQSQGAFDITVGPLIQLWRKARKTSVLPTPAEIKSARKLVGWQKIRLDGPTRRVRLTVPGMKLDLGGIAKGYAGDAAQEVLKKHGITRALVEMGGDIVVSDAPPDKKGWTLRSPNAGTNQGPVDLIVTNRAVSTSGDTEQFVVIGGKRYSHIVDPRTGNALTNRVQVTLIAPNGITSDPLTKTICVLHKKDSAKILKHYPLVKAYIKTLPGLQ